MKKLIFSFLAVAALASCVKEQTLSVPGAAEIGFAGTFVENATKANPTVTTESIDEFFVWGIIENEDGLVFTDEKVWKAGDWTYANTQYWVPAHNYYFSAIAGDRTDDQIVIRTAADEGMNTEGLGTVTFTNKEGMNDVLYAEYACETPSEITAQPEDVKFQFAHLLSKVKFTFQNGFVNEHNTIVIENIKMTVPRQGTIDLTADEFAWTALADETVLEMGHMQAAERLSIGASASSDNELLTIPAGADQEYKVTFTVKLYMGDVLASSADKEVKINGFALQQGKAYNFTALINEQNVDENPLFPITFDAEVVEWDEETIDYGTLAENNVVVYNAQEFQAALNSEKSINIFFGDNIAGDVNVLQKAGVNITVNGNGKEYDGSILVNGNARSKGAETLTFKNINFKSAENKTFLNAPSKVNDRYNYSHNVTIEDCTFTGNYANGVEVGAASFTGTYNLVMRGCVATDMHSLLQVQSCDNTVLVEDVKVVACKNGISVGNTAYPTIKNAQIASVEYGVRADGNASRGNLVIENSTITAKQPVVIRKVTTDGYILNVDEASVMTHVGDYDVIFTSGSDDAAYVAPVKAFTCNVPTSYKVFPEPQGWVATAEELAAALTANEENISVVLTSNIDLPISSLGQQTGGSGEYKLGGVNTKNITIDLNGKTLNVTTTYWSNLGAKNDNALFTIKNGTMTSSQSTGTWNSYDLTFSNCDYVIEDVVFEKAIAFDNASKAVTLKNVTINETHDYYAIWITADGQNVTIDGLTVNSAGRGIKIDEQYRDNPVKVTLKVNNATFKTQNKAAIMVKTAAGAEINVQSIDIANVAADTVNAVWVDEDAAAFASKVLVTGAKCVVEQ